MGKREKPAPGSRRWSLDLPGHDRKAHLTSARLDTDQAQNHHRWAGLPLKEVGSCRSVGSLSQVVTWRGKAQQGSYIDDDS